MARVCRDMARDLRAEAAAGWEDVPLTHTNGESPMSISRAEAARRMDAQATRWEAEAATGALNLIDRRRIGVA
jgi:hypothetical protein